MPFVTINLAFTSTTVVLILVYELIFEEIQRNPVHSHVRIELNIGYLSMRVNHQLPKAIEPNMNLG